MCPSDPSARGRSRQRFRMLSTRDIQEATPRTRAAPTFCPGNQDPRHRACGHPHTRDVHPEWPVFRGQVRFLSAPACVRFPSRGSGRWVRAVSVLTSTRHLRGWRAVASSSFRFCVRDRGSRADHMRAAAACGGRRRCGARDVANLEFGASECGRHRVRSGGRIGT